MDICLILDCSGSMHKMPRLAVDCVKQRLSTYPNSNVNIIQFGSMIDVIRDTKKYLNDWTEWGCGMGNTRLYDAIVAGITLFPRHLLLIVTDGEDTHSLIEIAQLKQIVTNFRNDGGRSIIIGPENAMRFIESDDKFEIISHDDIVNVMSSQEYNDSISKIMTQ